MAGWVFCNRCFQPPHRTSCFRLTNCGHVYCDVCLGKGGKDVCLICKVPCCTVLLSKHTDADIQALFMGIDGLCKKYSRETCQISEFQEKHRKRLLAFYREKIAKLEESLQKSALRMEQLQSMRLSQQTAFSAVKTPVSTKPGGHLLLPPDSSGSDRLESMQVDHTPSPMRKPEVAVGPARLSLISPPQHGRMGNISSLGPEQSGIISFASWELLERPVGFWSKCVCPAARSGPFPAGVRWAPRPSPSAVSPPPDQAPGSISHRGPQPLGLTPHPSSVSQALRIPLLPVPCKVLSQAAAPPDPGQAGRRGSPSLRGSQTLAPRPPISISALLQRQHLGKVCWPRGSHARKVNQGLPVSVHLGLSGHRQDFTQYKESSVLDEIK
ncbi:probable E3 SUMO-protein ligase RNF212 [Ursus arctos]|uniref:probable E3 SUMO-protein ligase RNF212 n=1 Tax=Ursus arctos TaxID=9644 RepID=UPI0020182409|nr:probable E3 SUMO-protein ligase RNF212 [Ursus arctos]